FMPRRGGGGGRPPEDVDSLLRCGADKVSVNTAAINDPTLISRVAERFGNQVLVLSVDARRERGEQHTQSGFEVTTMGGRKSTGIDALWWARRAEELGAGEVLLNSMDADGTQQGFDLEMIRAMREVVSIPIIASGGAGKAQDFPPAIAAGADAVLAASIFHYGKVTIGEVKDELRRAGYAVR
ncbi:imidazole glycerol phosphate synthase subunit HisF, partial [Bifidobacterium animalis]|uniref:imidazole glycerol phosphate synthase subunit HisF n=1 Tax=Bifidobacterium animalis TaxID=28025 RepID=UPI0023EAA285